LSPSSTTSSPVQIIGLQRGGGMSNINATSTAAAQQPRAHVVRSFAASSRAMEDTWACSRCTLRNNHQLSRCCACDTVNLARRSNSGRSAARSRVYDVDIDDTSGMERERDDQRSDQRRANISTFAAAAGSSHAHRPSASSTRMTREMPIGWGRSRSYYEGASAGDVDNGVSRNNTFLSQAFRQFHGFRESIDDMSYDRLLEVFGDGSENRGASSRAIGSLPVSILGNPKLELPEDKRQCSICLEDFCRADKRTSLPCLHGFHSACVNRWLASNGTCPVCKTSVSGS